MKNFFRAGSIAVFVIALSAIAVVAQPPRKAPDYKIAAINITPFNEASGKFEDVLTPDSDRSFFNDLSMSLFVTVDVAGEAGSFESGRMINITVKAGNKIKLSRRVQVGLIGEEGHYYVPIWLNGPMCSDISITATLSGQRATSTVKRRVPFLCGE